MYNSQEVANNIRAIAKEQKKALGKMLEECELSKNALSSMQAGYMPQLENICKIADYLKCSIDALLGRDIKKIAPIETNLDDLTEVLMQLDINELIEVREYAKLLLLRKQAQAEPTNR